jgi:hypothetical protein
MRNVNHRFNIIPPDTAHLQAAVLSGQPLRQGGVQ